MTITGALCCAELAAMMPGPGGQYVFLREAYGPLVGFLFGWSMFLVVQTGTIAAVAVAFAKFLGVLVPAVAAEHVPRSRRSCFGGYAISLSTPAARRASRVIVGSDGDEHARPEDRASSIQNTFTFTKTAALLGLIVVGLTLGANREAAAWTSSWWDPSANGWNPLEGPAGPGADRARRRSCCCWARR